MSDNNSVYYRIIKSDKAENIAGLSVVTMQWFDETDYDPKQFATDEQFATEEEAQGYIEGEELKILRAFWRALKSNI